MGERKQRGPEEKAKGDWVWKHSGGTVLWLHVNWSDLKKNPIFLECRKGLERAEGKRKRDGPLLISCSSLLPNGPLNNNCGNLHLWCRYIGHSYTERDMRLKMNSPLFILFDILCHVVYSFNVSVPKSLWRIVYISLNIQLPVFIFQK